MRTGRSSEEREAERGVSTALERAGVQSGGGSRQGGAAEAEAVDAMQKHVTAVHSSDASDMAPWR